MQKNVMLGTVVSLGDCFSKNCFLLPCNQTVRVETYLLNDDNFSGSCCLMLDADTFGEFVALTKLTGVGLIADKEKEN